MNRYVSEQLMTVDEAKRLSGLQTGRDEREHQARQASIWAWQSLRGALTQTVTEQQVDEVMRTPRKR